MLSRLWRKLTDDWPFVMFAIWILLVVIWVINALFITRWAPSVPKCPEDAMILGGGEYRNGYWDYLYCGPSLP